MIRPIHSSDYGNYLLQILFMGLNTVISGFLWMYVVPKWLGLPNGKQPISQYLNEIGLKHIKPLLKPMAYGMIVVFGYVFFIVTQNIYLSNNGYFYTDPSDYIFSTIYMIFQEIVFRGIILVILLKKYSKFTSILLNALLSALFYLGNRFNPFLSDSMLYIFEQTTMFSLFLNTILLFFISIVSAYMVIKTKSLVSGIIIGCFTYAPIFLISI